MSNGFDEVLVQQLMSSPEWNEIERTRWQYQALRVILWIPGLLVGWLGIWFMIPEEAFSLSAAVIGLIVVAFAASMIRGANRMARKRFNRRSKQFLIPKLIAMLPQLQEGRDDQANYEASRTLDMQTIAAIPMFYPYRNGVVTAEDVFEVQLPDRTIQYEEITLRKHDSSAWPVRNWSDYVFNFFYGLIKRMSWKFQGLLLVVNYNEPISSGTTTFYTRWNPARRCIRAKGKRLSAGSAEFHRHFKVKSTAPDEGEQLLNDRWTESFLSLRNLFPRRFMASCLHENKIAIAIQGYDLFEWSSMRMPELDNVKDLYSELCMIVDAAEALDRPEAV